MWSPRTKEADEGGIPVEQMMSSKVGVEVVAMVTALKSCLLPTEVCDLCSQKIPYFNFIMVTGLSIIEKWLQFTLKCLSFAYKSYLCTV